MNILTELKGRFRIALAKFADQPASLLDMIRPAQDARFGDYQANCAMPLGKQLGRPPREVAESICAEVELSDLCDSLEIAGPGFINLRLRNDWLIEQLQVAQHDQRLGVAPVPQPRSYVVDYSSPNVAKPMHVGHIRSTVIGDALCHVLRFLGHRVISDNHVGDWGTQFGMIIYGYRHFRNDAAYQDRPVDELCRLYKFVRQLTDYHESHEKLPAWEQKLSQLEETIADEQAAVANADQAAQKKLKKSLRKLQQQRSETRSAIDTIQTQLAAVDNNTRLAQLAQQHADIGAAVLRETAKLHAGDAANLKLWNEFLPRCSRDIRKIYDRLGVSFDVELGESHYQPLLEKVVDDLLSRGLAEPSEGAICLFLDGFSTPMIIRKQDGAYLYATTDLATIQYRIDTWRPDAILYVVDFRQGEHFDKLFAAARRWGHEDVELVHVSFGTVLGEDGRPFKTRSGDTVELEGLLDEAVRRAKQVVSENDDGKPGGPELSEPQRDEVASAIGHAAIKYADLSQNRSSDYVFSYDKMVAMQGNTATYMQYSYARIQNIFSRGGVDIEALRNASACIALGHDAERCLALQVLRFSEALDEVAADYRPNHLTSYLYELAKRFSEFYEACHVLRADTPGQRDSRLLLCDLTGRTLKLGLALLGIRVVDKM